MFINYPLTYSVSEFNLKTMEPFKPSVRLFGREMGPSQGLHLHRVKEVFTFLLHTLSDLRILFCVLFI